MSAQMLDVVLQSDIRGELPLILDRYGKPIPCNETEDRIERLARGLRRVGGVTFSAPEVSDAELAAAIGALHDPGYLAFLDHWSGTLPDGEMLLFDHPHLPAGIDPDTPIIGGILHTARESARTAITAAHRAADGAAAYALCRPPGHHAGRDFLGGHCYINNAALAVATLHRRGFRRVALIDFDIHFGNGSSALLEPMPFAFFGSIHGATDISYPYIETHPPNERQVFLPFSAPPTPAEFLGAVDELIARALAFGAEALVVSAGYDIVAGDPHGTWTLAPAILEPVGVLCARSGHPLCVVQEGGYNPGLLADCAEHFARGVLTARRHAHDARAGRHVEDAHTTVLDPVNQS